jgi:hypothetical protein
MLFSATSVFAEGSLVSRYSDDKLIQIIKNEGYGSVEKIKEGTIRVKVDGHTLAVFNKPDGDLQLYYSVAGSKVTVEDMNEWNRTRRLSRAYLDADKDPTLESDLLANAGMTEKHVTEFFSVFKTSVDAFRDFIIKHNHE